MDHIRKIVSAVIYVMDARSGEPVKTGWCRVRVQGDLAESSRQVIAKPGSYYVLTDITGDTYEVSIEGIGYQPLLVSISPGKSKFYSVWLLADETSTFPADTTFIYGLCSRKNLTIITQRKDGLGRLCADAESGSRVISLSKTYEIVEGRTFKILDSQSEEYIMIMEEKEGSKAADKQQYCLSEALHHTYNRKTSSLCNVFCVSVRDDGSYFYAFSNFPDKNGILQVYAEDKQLKVPNIISGTKNELHFWEN